ncbi:hypothetical protein ILUMI_15460, partial [Ignelater luminosus]
MHAKRPKIQVDNVVIQDCPALYSLLERKSINERNVNYIRKALCGLLRRQPYMCCPVTAKNSTNTPDLFPSRKVCGIQAENTILGGMDTTIRDYPWMVLLQYQEPNYRRFECGGFLINNRYVLTAAHCLLNIPSYRKLIKVCLGEHNLKTAIDCENKTPGLEDCSDEPLDITIEEQIPHELYIPNSTNHQHDIALLRLSKTVEFT